MIRIRMGILFASLVWAAAAAAQAGPSSDSLWFTGERHLANIRQLTFGGQNAEAYFGADGKRLSLQRTGDAESCDQIYAINADGTGLTRISNGLGHCTCSFLSPDGRSVIYASTFAAADTCPPRPDYSHGYVWPVYATYDIYIANADGSHPKRISDRPGYNAECVFSNDGRKILFTSDRDGDLELYTMKPDGSDVRRITHALGYDGGAFFSPDGRKIVYRADHYADSTSAAAREYRELLAQHLVKPSHMEIMVCDADGGHPHAVTRNGAANFAPFFAPDGKHIIFASNKADPKGRDFDLYRIREDGKGEERLTFCPDFDAFPMFTRDGKHLVFASNRHGKVPHETNIFIADWKE